MKNVQLHQEKQSLDMTEIQCDTNLIYRTQTFLDDQIIAELGYKLLKGKQGKRE